MLPPSNRAYMQAFLHPAPLSLLLPLPRLDPARRSCTSPLRRLRPTLPSHCAPFPHRHARPNLPTHTSRPSSTNPGAVRLAPVALSGGELAGAAVRSSSAALSNLDPKRAAAWGLLALALYVVRPFFPVLVGTFILGYVANSVVRALAGRAPRRLVVGVFYAFIVTAIGAFSVMTIPTVVRESQYFISTLQSENPYVYVANSLRKTLGDELTSKLETYVVYSIQMPEAAAKGTLPPAPPVAGALGLNDVASASAAAPAASSSTEKASALRKNNRQRRDDGNTQQGAQQGALQGGEEEWTEERSRRLGILLQKSIRSYIAATISLITKLLGASTKVIFKALLSLIFSFMLMWDLPVIVRGVRRLKTSRVSFIYDELAPVVTKFGSVLGKSFEAQGLIALTNTTLTTAGLLALSIPGVGFLSLVTLLCSFIPVAGVFISTLPMCVIALSEFGVAKALAVIVMVIIVHLIEAYVLNPQIYSAHLHLHPFMVLTVLYIAEHSYGIPGLLLAVPVAVYVMRTILLDDPESEEEGNAVKQLEVGASAVSDRPAEALPQSDG